MTRMDEKVRKDTAFFQTAKLFAIKMLFFLIFLEFVTFV